MSIDDMNKFKQKEMKTKRPIKDAWHDWLINYIPNPIKKIVGGCEGKVLSLSKDKHTRGIW